VSENSKTTIRKFRRQDETKVSRKDMEKYRTTQRRLARRIKALTNSTI